MSQLLARKIRSTSSLDFTFFDNLVDDKQVVMDYILTNFQPDQIFIAMDIPLFRDILDKMGANKKVLDILWALLYKDMIELEEASVNPVLFKRKKAIEPVYVKTKRKYNRKLRQASNSGLPVSGSVLDSDKETT